MSVVVLRLGRYFLGTLLLNNWCSTSKGDRTYKFPSSPGFRIFYAGHIESITSWQKFMKSCLELEPVLKDGLDTREKKFNLRGENLHAQFFDNSIYNIF